MEFDPHNARRLFQAVVTQALVDATSAPKSIAQKVKRLKEENDIEYATRRKRVLANRQAASERERDEARKWLTEGGLAFQQICSLAGYNPDDIRERAMRLADRRWPKPVMEAEAA